MANIIRLIFLIFIFGMSIQVYFVMKSITDKIEHVNQQVCNQLKEIDNTKKCK
jgi:hypothetical protein